MPRKLTTRRFTPSLGNTLGSAQAPHYIGEDRPTSGWPASRVRSAPLFISENLPPPYGPPTTWRELGLPRMLLPIPAPARLPKLATSDEKGAVQQIYRAIGAEEGQGVAVIRSDGIEDVILGRVATPVGMEDVHLTDSFVRHLVEDKLDHREQFANYILPAFSDPAEVWRTYVEVVDGERCLQRQIFITAFDDGFNAVAVAQTDPGLGWLAWTLYPRYGINRLRKGHLLYHREGGKGK